MADHINPSLLVRQIEELVRLAREQAAQAQASLRQIERLAESVRRLATEEAARQQVLPPAAPRPAGGV
ncbi:MAG: hypothetical protein U0637_14175 [Phycisphaerales bacterium]